MGVGVGAWGCVFQVLVSVLGHKEQQLVSRKAGPKINPRDCQVTLVCDVVGGCVLWCSDRCNKKDGRSLAFAF